MAYLISLGILVVAIFTFVSIKQKAFVNGISVLTAHLVIFNVILPVIYVFYNGSKNINYMYVLLYYGVYFISVSSGYYLTNKQHKIQINLFEDINYNKQKVMKYGLLALIVVICLTIAFLVPVELLKNPRYLYEKTRMGYGPIYFGITTLVNYYIIFVLFSKEKKYGLIFAFILLYFTGSKVRMLMPLEVMILYYFYVVSKDRYNLKKIALACVGTLAVFYFVFAVTSYFLPNKDFNTVILQMSNFSDYNRNFVELINKLSDSKQWFFGKVTFENNFYSFIPRFIFSHKPQIFGSFRLSYLVYPEATLLFKGAPSFGEFGGLFGDFGHWSLIIIAIFNFIRGGILALAEKNFIKNKNIISFMIFLIFVGMNFIDVGLVAAIILFINIVGVIVIYWIIKRKQIS